MDKPKGYETIKIPKCPEGTKWWPVKKKCVPAGQEKRQGLGVPMDKVKEGMNSVFDEFKVHDKIKIAQDAVDTLLEMCGRVHKEQEDEDELDSGKADIDTTGRPYDHPIKTGIKEMFNRIIDECEGSGMGPISQAGFVDSEYDEGPSKEDDPHKKQNVINTVPNQDIGGLYTAVRKQMQEYKNLSENDKESYKAFFASMLKKWGVNSPAELSDDKKKEFFNAVSAGWKSTTEQMAIKAASTAAKGLRRFGRGARKAAKGGFGTIKGKVAQGGFGSIAGKLEQDDLEDEGEEEEE